MSAAGQLSVSGSTDLLTEFFDYCINSILYQRGIYPPEMFKRGNKYGLPLLMATDATLRKYLDQVLAKLKGWLLDRVVQKIVLVVIGLDTAAILERWTFNVACDKTASGSSKEESTIKTEIQALIRQIIASVCVLPLLNEPCKFDMLVHTDTDVEIPIECEESAPLLIATRSEVGLRGVGTDIHNVQAAVEYRVEN